MKASPILADLTEQPVLDGIPLRSAGRIVADVNCNPCLIGELLQAKFPSAVSIAVASAAIGENQHPAGVFVAILYVVPSPVFDGVHRKLGCVVRSPDEDEAEIRLHVVDAVGYGDPLSQGAEIWALEANLSHRKKKKRSSY